MSIPELTHVSEGPQRFDVFTGSGRRRRFTAAEKAAIVEEGYAVRVPVDLDHGFNEPASREARRAC